MSASDLQKIVFEDINVQQDLDYPSDEDKLKLRWGKHTWIMLHSLAHKVKDSAFNKIRDDLIHQICEICANLPCNTCSVPAKSYLDCINFDAINDRYSLQRMLFNFHNDVNSKLNKPMLSLEDLTNKYANLTVNDVFNNFKIYFNFGYYGMPDMIEFENKRRITSDNFSKWMEMNMINFE